MISPVLNSDGVSVQGCTYIYAPAGQAGEYAPLACNPYRGCGYSCAYCYVPKVTKQPRDEFNQGAVDRKDFVDKFLRDAKKYQALGVTEQVMLSFTSDPFHAGDNGLTIFTIAALKEHGLAFCTHKGRHKSIESASLIQARAGCFCINFDIVGPGSRKWEPKAALPADRIEALKAFHDAGIFTWVSLEPTLDIESSLEIVRQTHTFVDLYKVGRANYLPMTATTNWKEYTRSIVILFAELGIKHYIKKDLQGYLPDYYNPKRIPQNNAVKTDLYTSIAQSIAEAGGIPLKVLTGDKGD